LLRFGHVSRVFLPFWVRNLPSIEGQLVCYRHQPVYVAPHPRRRTHRPFLCVRGSCAYVCACVRCKGPSPIPPGVRLRRLDRRVDLTHTHSFQTCSTCGLLTLDTLLAKLTWSIPRHYTNTRPKKYSKRESARNDPKLADGLDTDCIRIET